MNELLDWFTDQWTSDAMYHGTWYNIPAMVLGAVLVCGVVIVCGSAIAYGEAKTARLGLVLLFLGPIALLVWPLTLTLVVLFGLFKLVNIAWQNP